MSTLLELAERCEQVTGPDRVLDAEIAATLHVKQLTYQAPKWIKDPEFTASLDAAMTLVPEGCHLQHFGDTDADNPQARRWTAAIRAREGGGVLWDGEARVWCATGPLAVCAAAMHARASAIEGRRRLAAPSQTRARSAKPGRHNP